MIGWYVHHHGHGHLHRASAVARHLDEDVTGLSSLTPPEDWPGQWILLPRDDDGGRPQDPTARDALHWVPVGHAGLRSRAAAVSAWIETARPRVVVVDVSVEVALLARLHGVPVVSFAMPGRRDDRVHRLGYDVCSAIVAPWPSGAGPLVAGLDEDDDRVRHVGAIARHPVSGPDPVTASRSVVVLLGSGGDDDLAPGWLDRARAATPDCAWTALGGSAGTWLRDPWSVIRSADVVVTHAGQNAVAEVAAARRPAVVVPLSRPFGEQWATADALRAPRWPAEVLDPRGEADWRRLIDRVSRWDGDGWRGWCDGQGAARTARVVAEVASGRES